MGITCFDKTYGKECDFIQPYFEEERILPGEFDGSFSCFTTGTDNRKLYVPPHFHKYIEIVYTKKGNMKVLLNNRYRDVGEGMLAVIDSGQVHATLLDQKVETRCIVMKFDPEIFPSALFQSGYFLSLTGGLFRDSQVFTGEELSGSGLPALIESVLAELQNREYGYDLAAKAEISSLFLWITRSRYPEREKERIRTFYNLPQIHRMGEIYAFLQKNYAEELSARETAERFHMSYSYFSRMFKRISGKTFTEYLNTIRIDEAERLLLTTALSVTEVASRCGYGSTSYFIRQFRLWKHDSPKQFLKRMHDNAV